MSMSHPWAVAGGVLVLGEGDGDGEATLGLGVGGVEVGNGLDVGDGLLVGEGLEGVGFGDGLEGGGLEGDGLKVGDGLDVGAGVRGATTGSAPGTTFGAAEMTGTSEASGTADRPPSTPAAVTPSRVKAAVVDALTCADTAVGGTRRIGPSVSAPPTAASAKAVPPAR